jgi:hypothetical protein
MTSSMSGTRVTVDKSVFSARALEFRVCVDGVPIVLLPSESAALSVAYGVVDALREHGQPVRPACIVWNDERAKDADLLMEVVKDQIEAEYDLFQDDPEMGSAADVLESVTLDEISGCVALDISQAAEVEFALQLQIDDEVEDDEETPRLQSIMKTIQAARRG